MKRISFQLGIALITFSFGVGAAWLVLLISQPAVVEIEPPPTSAIIIRPAPETPAAAPSAPATVVFRRSYKNKHGLVLAEFKVTNISSEPLHYAGVFSNPNWNRYYSVRRGNQLEEPERACATGLAGHTLLPGKSVRFEVVAGDEPGRVQVGFEFIVGESRHKQTIWGDEVYVSE
ncbi:MAG TPA: hypothetical protein VIP46_15185 [Pyrinomonadaceae bacterium]